MTKAPNGRGSIHRSKDRPGTWEGWVTFPYDPVSGKSPRKHVRGKTKAAVAAEMTRLERARDGGYSAVGSDPTFADWLAYWIESRRLSARPKTVAGYRVDEKHVSNSGVGRIKLTRLTPEDIEGLYRWVLDRPTTSVGSVMHLRRTISAALGVAVARGRIPRNPVQSAAKPTYDLAEVEPLTASEARRVLSAARRQRTPARWSIGLSLGLRQGEVLGLQWQDIDLEDGTLRVRRQLQRQTWQHGCAAPDRCVHPRTGKPARGCDCPMARGGGLVAVEVKTAAGRRPLALPEPLLVELRVQRKGQVAERLAAGSEWQADQPEWVFAWACCTEL